MELFEAFREYGWYLGTFAFFLASGVLPFLNCELYLLWMAVTAPREDLFPLLLVGTVGQMLAKAVLFAAGRGAVHLPLIRGGEKLESLRRSMAGGTATQVWVTFASATLGLPPFYWFSLAAGALRWSFAPFFVLGFIGRLVRFGAVLFVPQGLAGLLHFDVRPIAWAVAAVTGLLVGLHIATWNVADAGTTAAGPIRRYVPNIAVGVAVALAWEALLSLDLTQPKARLLLFGLTYAGERGLMRLHRAVRRTAPTSIESEPLARAAMVALLWAALAVTLTHHYLLVALCSVGYAIATLDTHRGLFQRRALFAPLAIVIGMVLLGHVAVSFGHPLVDLAGL